MKNIVVFFCLAFGLLTDAIAQEKGQVRSARTRQPLEGVNIYLQNDSVGLGATDKEGTFDTRILRRCTPQDTIVFSHVGHTPLKCTTEILQRSQYQVDLFENIQMLSEVEVEAEEWSYFLPYRHESTMPQGLYSFGSFLRDGKIYILAGDMTRVSMSSGDEEMPIVRLHRFRSPDIYTYDIDTKTWEKKKNKLIKRACFAAQPYNDRVYLLGGIRYSLNERLELTDENIEVYDLTKDTVYRQPSNLHLGKNPASFIYDDLLFIMNGSKTEHSYNGKIHALDLKRGYWFEIGDIPDSLNREMNGILVDNTVYFFGGKRKLPPKHWDINTYNLQTGQWKHIGEMNDGVYFPGLTRRNELIFIYENNRLQVYNLLTKRISSYPINLGLEGAALHIYGKKLYIVGGCHRNGEIVSPAESIISVDISKFYQ
ncbi:MAG: carboxypeptidase-like regulatory domain-containing protein [Bacteroides sp.]|nr:carboxypeptidase-like regulatory domain-containing protein [Bacteroides sp.]